MTLPIDTEVLDLLNICTQEIVEASGLDIAVVKLVRYSGRGLGNLWVEWEISYRPDVEVHVRFCDDSSYASTPWETSWQGHKGREHSIKGALRALGEKLLSSFDPKYFGDVLQHLQTTLRELQCAPESQ